MYQRSTNSKCPLCDQCTVETGILIKGFKNRLLQKNIKQDEEYQQIKSDQDNKKDDIFSKVIQMITFSQTNPIRVNCNHRKIYRQIYRKMRCSQSLLKQNCRQTLMEVSHKRYQLDIIAQQVSIIEDRALQMIRKQKRKMNKRNRDRSDHQLLFRQQQNNRNSEGKIEKNSQMTPVIKQQQGQKFFQPGPQLLQNGLIYLSFIIPQFEN